jgi:ferredoxin
MLYIHTTECIDRGACEPACPTEAIRPAQRLGERRRPFQAASADVLAGIGATGVSGNVDDPLPDPPFVAEFGKGD